MSDVQQARHRLHELMKGRPVSREERAEAIGELEKAWAKRLLAPLRQGINAEGTPEGWSVWTSPEGKVQIRMTDKERGCAHAIEFQDELQENAFLQLITGAMNDSRATRRGSFAPVVGDQKMLEGDK